MSLIVQKFGGTSVADTQKILAAARKAIRAAKQGNQVVMVVSAMGKNTDHLIALANEITERPSAREMDMLMSTGEQVTISLMAIALESLGYKAVSYTGGQMGILTDSAHMRARIHSIDAERMKKSLNEGNIIIAAGFQGVDENGEITTLGRGGSDTTAVALAAALGADSCEIYTDVDGVYTTDPRIVPEARQLERISYDEMLELASLGAGVMHSRSIEFGKKFKVPIHVRSSITDKPGTLITDVSESIEAPVCGAALAKNEARITINGVPDKPGVAMSIFSKIAEANIPTDMIVQNVSDGGVTDISFTIPGSDLQDTLEVVQQAADEIGAKSVEYDENVSKVSIVGIGMEYRSGIAEKMFRAIADKGINIQMITTSEIKISILVSKEDGVNALRAAHDVFEMYEPPKPNEDGKLPEGYPSGDEHTPITSEALAHYTGMEDIVIESVILDQYQSRITLRSTPDLPGVAADVFEQVAREGVIVDMIVQSAGKNGKADITFSCSRRHSKEAFSSIADVAKKFNCPDPICEEKVAKLTVRGTGLRSHTGLAFRMFKTLADAGINVGLINTSERSINVVINDEDGSRAFDVLRKEFKEEIF